MLAVRGRLKLTNRFHFLVTRCSTGHQRRKDRRLPVCKNDLVADIMALSRKHQEIYRRDYGAVFGKDLYLSAVPDYPEAGISPVLFCHHRIIPVEIAVLRTLPGKPLAGECRFPDLAGASEKNHLPGIHFGIEDVSADKPLHVADLQIYVKKPRLFYTAM